jgi:hypothetical protein
MIWQDIVITIVYVALSAALLPQIIKGFKERKGHIVIYSSAPTAIGLYVVAATFLTLGLVLSSIISFITATMWLILMIQKLVYK